MKFLGALLPAAVAVAVLTIGLPAAAQVPGAGTGFGGSMGTPTGPVVQPRGTGEKPREPAPPAVPGARSGSAPVVPSDKAAADMTPNDALFDAINRGDIAAVRDAINRGAELRGHNILGLTPTELAIDLGRNEITFLLLSMRGSTADDEASAAAAAQAAAPRAGARPTPPARVARTDPAASAADAAPSPRSSREARAAAAKAQAVPVAAAPITAAPAARSSMTATTTAPAPASVPPAAPARQFAAGVDGTAIPQMGFLGFGGVAR